LISKLPVLKKMSPDDMNQMMNGKDTLVLDIRHYDSFGGQHISGAYHIDLDGNFSTFAGWVLPPDMNILLVSYDDEQAEKARIGLHRVGLDRVIGFLDGSMFAWSKSGLPSGHIGQLSSGELHEMSTDSNRFVIVDVRAPSEYHSFHIQGAVNIPVADLRTRHRELDLQMTIAVVCSTGHRSSLGASILKQHGFKDLRNVAGGMTGYSAAGYAPECPVCFVPHGPHFLGKALK
jgi:rhodanese-related sulfurtransferase